MVSGKNVILKKVNVSHLNVLLDWENNPENWKYSSTVEPFTEFEIRAFIFNQSTVELTNQIRFIIHERISDVPIGAIDLFEINFKHGFAGVGILIADKAWRNRGFASESIEILKEYAKNELKLTNLHCSIQSDNPQSIKIFEKCGFKQIGTRKNWFSHEEERLDEYLFQLCLKK